MTFHLSHEQLCDLVAADLAHPDKHPRSTGAESCIHSADSNTNANIVEEHLRACPVCSAELSSLRDSLLTFREASVAYSSQLSAHQHIRWSSIAPAPHRFLSQPLYWAAAALTIAVALLPVTLHRHSAISPNAAVTSQAANAQAIESDEDLLADIDQKVTADVPTPLEPLADPTATAVTSDSSSEQRKN